MAVYDLLTAHLRRSVKSSCLPLSQSCQGSLAEGPAHSLAQRIEQRHTGLFEKRHEHHPGNEATQMRAKRHTRSACWREGIAEELQHETADQHHIGRPAHSIEKKPIGMTANTRARGKINK